MNLSIYGGVFALGRADNSIHLVVFVFQPSTALSSGTSVVVMDREAVFFVNPHSIFRKVLIENKPWSKDGDWWCQHDLHLIIFGASGHRLSLLSEASVDERRKHRMWEHLTRMGDGSRLNGCILVPSQETGG